MLGILPQFFKFKVVDGTSLGRAIVATDEIEEGEIICKITGTYMTFKQMFDKFDETDWSNPLQIGSDLYIDVVPPYLYFNHSCDPNAGVRNNGIIFALKKITPGEEIFFDYSTTIDDVMWSMECRCGAKICRKVIGDFMTIPHERKEFYLEKNAIMRFIKEIFY